MDMPLASPFTRTCLLLCYFVHATAYATHTRELPPQAIAAWRDASGYARCQLVRSYFQAVAGFTEPEVLTKVELQPGSSSSSSSGGAQGGVGALGAALAKALGPLGTLFERSSSDAFYAVVAYRNFKRE